MNRSISFDDLCSTISSLKGKSVVVFSHAISDRDGIASAASIADFLGPNATLTTPDFITRNAKLMLEQVNRSSKIKSSFPNNATAAIIVDANNLDAVGKFESDLKKFKGKIIFIDHHVAHKDMQIDCLMFNDENYNATSSIVYEMLKKIEGKISKEVAVMLLNGIIADSAMLQNTSPLTFRQIADLISISGKSYADIINYFHENISAESRLSLINDIYASNAEKLGKYVIVVGKAAMHANIAADMALELGADFALFWSVTESEATISGRLRQGLDSKLGLNLGLVMQSVGNLIDGNGGGHSCAAGAYGPKKDGVQSAVDSILKEVKQKLGSHA